MANEKMLYENENEQSKVYEVTVTNSETYIVYASSKEAAHEIAVKEFKETQPVKDDSNLKLESYPIIRMSDYINLDDF